MTRRVHYDYTGQCTECGKALYDRLCMAGCRQNPTPAFTAEMFGEESA